jgi:hypothetical protein
MNPNLTEQLERELTANDGFLEGPSYVVMSRDVYRRLVGVPSEDDLADSLAAIDQAVGELEAGKSIPLDEAFRRLDEKHGL